MTLILEYPHEEDIQIARICLNGGIRLADTPQVFQKIVHQPNVLRVDLGDQFRAGDLVLSRLPSHNSHLLFRMKKEPHLFRYGS